MLETKTQCPQLGNKIAYNIVEGQGAKDQQNGEGNGW